MANDSTLTRNQRDAPDSGDEIQSPRALCNSEDDREILNEIRTTYEYYSESWRAIREEARKDMSVIVEGPWDSGERAARNPINGPKRPCLSLDELSQYLNQAEGNIRQSKRGVKIEPRGAGTNDQTAELDQGIIRQIEYESRAVEAYIGAYVSMLQRSYGAARIRRKYLPGKTMDMVLEVDAIRNPDCVLPDPDAQKSDYSDMKRCFVLDPLRKEVFKRKYPWATIHDFNGEHQKIAPQWITDQQVLTAEYWRLQEERRKLIMFGADYRVEYLDELPEGTKEATGNKKQPMLMIPGEQPYQILKTRETVDPFVTMYLTNGLEILEETPWTVEIETSDKDPQTGAPMPRKLKGGIEIPILFITGKEVFYQKTDGAAAERYIFSMIRLARDPYMLYCYARTCQAEILGQVPKVPAMGAVGQFEGFEEDWKNAGRVPLGYLQYHAITEETGDQVLPPPQQPRFEPPLQEMEIVAQAARAAIQASIGITGGVLNGRPGQNADAKSGVALKTLEQQTAEGSYHFIDAYDAMVARAGRIMEDNIPVVYDTARDQPLRLPKGDQRMVRINDPDYIDPENPEKGPQLLRTDTEPHQVTVTTGPSQQSEREAADSLVDSIVSNQQIVGLALQNPQSTAAKLLSMAIKLKDLGPLGDQIAEDINPQQQGGIPPEIQQQMQGMQQKLEQATALVGHLTQELKEKTQQKQIEMQFKRVIAADKNRTDMVIAEIKMKHEGALAELDAEMQRIEAMWDHLHESELAPGPDSAPNPETAAAGLGVHPQEIPQPEPAESGAAQ